MQLREVNLKSQLKDRSTLEKQAEEMKVEVGIASQNLKVIIQLTFICFHFFAEACFSRNLIRRLRLPRHRSRSLTRSMSRHMQN